MKLLNCTDKRVTIEFSRRELHLVKALIQEGRVAVECEPPKGQALEDGVRSAVIMVEEAIKSGQEITNTH